MSLDDFFRNAEEEWKKLKQLEADAAKRAAEEERQRRIEELKARREGRKPNPPPPASASPAAPPVVTSLADYIKLENIECRDAEGNVFERYDMLYVAKDIVRKPDHSQVDKKPHDWAVYFEGQGLFLPSFALSCNIVAALYRQKANPDVERVLQQYNDLGDGYGWQAQNTLVDYAAEQVIHYPTAAGFGERNAVNNSLAQKELSFSKATLQDSLLKDALRDPAAARYVKQLTGLAEPQILVEIGDYFSKPAKLWFPWNGQDGAGFTEKRAAWLGCYRDSFNLYSNYYLYDTGAARGVRLDQPRSGAQLRGSP